MSIWLIILGIWLISLFAVGIAYLVLHVGGPNGEIPKPPQHIDISTKETERGK